MDREYRNILGATIPTVIIIVILMTLLLKWSINHDKKVMESSERYEDCIMQEYGISPAQWYIENGEYPKCGN